MGVGCPQCSIIGVSERENRLKFELAAAGLTVVQDHPPIAVDGRRPVKADIVIRDLRVVSSTTGLITTRLCVAATAIKRPRLNPRVGPFCAYARIHFRRLGDTKSSCYRPLRSKFSPCWCSMASTGSGTLLGISRTFGLTLGAREMSLNRLSGRRV